MVELRIAIRDGEPDLLVRNRDALDSTLVAAAAEAREVGRLNIVSLTAPHGDRLSIVLGGVETVVTFDYGHGDPPYYVSVGNTRTDDPALTAFVGLVHHTEFPRRWVVSIGVGRLAARDFLQSGERPNSCHWWEV